MEKALAGYRVLDLTHVQSGPTCTQLMGFLGADVIKVEPPSGDVTRGQLRDIPEADSLYFTMLNCNKRSVVIDLKQERGKEVFSDLLRKADILIENFGKGTLDRLGFTWETVHKINPRVILASIKGYGSTGPYSDFPAYEMAVQAMGGNMGVTGFADGPPIVSHAAIADAGSGVNMLAGILAALLQRERTGKGQRVEVAMMDVAVGWIRTKLRDQQRPGFEEPKRTGNDSGGGQPGYLVKCKPGGLNDYIFIYTSNRRDVWEALCRHMAREDWISDPKFATPKQRYERREEIFVVIEEWAKAYTKWELMEILSGIGAPAGPVLSTKEILEDKHLRQRQTIVDVKQPIRGSFKNVGCPIKLSDSPVEVTSAPALGQHTNEVLQELLGYPDAKLTELRGAKIIG
jgi:formyl-CoA transferase